MQAKITKHTVEHYLKECVENIRFMIEPEEFDALANDMLQAMRLPQMKKSIHLQSLVLVTSQSRRI